MVRPAAVAAADFRNPRRLARDNAAVALLKVESWVAASLTDGSLMIVSLIA
jgi:hypothetical protein